MREALEKEGWTRQATYDEPRLSEMVDFYREIGYEIHIELFNPGDDPADAACMNAAPGTYKTIYTKKSPE